MQMPLSKALRSQLEKTVIKARDIAEKAVREELQRLSVSDKNRADYLTTDQRSLRKRLRAHSRQLGGVRKPNGEQDIENLVTEAAYEHWHRMLFARFLAENNLLMYEDGKTPLAIQDCFDLAEEDTGDSSKGWQYAANYAAKMLPQIFRIDSPVFSIELAPNYQNKLEQLLAGLDVETFEASDSLGWVYQFWQTKKKDAVNRSEVKIGADELPAVTQLFTEPYMVSFLLDNSLGAWWKSNHPDKLIPIPLTYLRTLENGTPAAGKFEAWPKQLGELKVLDPCCGSGHFLVEAFLMLVPMRMTAENLSANEAVDAVLTDNIHGLELDQRCVELAAFALALTAWRYPNAGGYRVLPELHIAWVGQPIKENKAEWMLLAGNDDRLLRGMELLYDTFKDAPILGSLISPNHSVSADLLTDGFNDLKPLLNKVLGGTLVSTNKEIVIAAKGLMSAADLLSKQYNLVITNVPYLSFGDFDSKLSIYCADNYCDSKFDLANVFFERCFDFFKLDGTQCLVMPQGWLYKSSYKKHRKYILNNKRLKLIVKLGSGAFDGITGEEVNVILLCADNNKRKINKIEVIDVLNSKDSINKGIDIKSIEMSSILQNNQLKNNGYRIITEEYNSEKTLANYCEFHNGLCLGDQKRFLFCSWEMDYVSFNKNEWLGLQSTTKVTSDFKGYQYFVFWENGNGRYQKYVRERLGEGNTAAWIRGKKAWNKRGVLISAMGKLKASMYMGSFFDDNAVAIIPHDEKMLAAIWAFCSSSIYHKKVREIDQSLKVRGPLIQVEFNSSYWSKIANETFPKGLPKPYSDDPTQWIFHGHPAQSEQALHVAVARLLDYQWPAESDTKMELSDEARSWVDKTKNLTEFVDDDGIVCLSAVRGEKPAHVRLEELLHSAFGDEWSIHTLNALLEEVGCKNKGLDVWLREKFFEQHCKLFQYRPFIWHIWDGLTDGFSALVNYHMLDKKNLERLIYTYLDDWIRTQNLQQADGVDGAMERLRAAESLKQRLELILEGEAPYDIFVRWKPLKEQPMGWNPDINDGVRLNIRPLMSVADVGKKDAGVLRAKPNIHWKKDRGKDVESAPWFNLGLEYGGKEGDRINDHHLTLVDKKAARDKKI
jgi:hypothetical protein